ncbi:MAG: VOC family protein [Salinivirgaceae bacterium]|nr:VOC family protein [Salinivirgaceae bacterium]MDD4746318.1 VOC family protein [Salinivirgaceae bacterium]MDY0281790.1 VOC family protein [Salinivirgaceae bacterium]
MQKIVISGIQQMGVGVSDVKEAWNWYIKHFGMDIRVFEEKAVAKLMLPHTNGEPRERYAALAINMNGGGGFEIWQHTGKTPEKPLFDLQIGDLGICVAKLKCRSINETFAYQKKVNTTILGEISTMPNGQKHFFVQDPYNNIFEFVEEPIYFSKLKNIPSGGTYGAIIGVANMEESLPVYRDILGYDEIAYDETKQFDDLAALPGGNGTFRRVLLKHSEIRKGAFAALFGPTQIELVQAMDYTPRNIFEGRIWGDPGFIHLCFDVQGMSAIRELCEKKGFPFTVDSSNSFDMGAAAGHFTYIQAPEGTLIEFVETHKVPILKKLGWYIDLTKRDPEKSLPMFILKAMGLNRVKSV